jgi:SAM-dependent methyltransferase
VSRRFVAREGFAEARALYAAGENVTQGLKQRYPDPAGWTDVIRVAYDLQSGTYVQQLGDPAVAEKKAAIAGRILSFLDGLALGSALEAGCGEATTLVGLMQGRPDLRWAGFDLSLSRLVWARGLLAERGCAATLFAADLAQIPLRDAAVDLVVTVHALEPNGDRAAALTRLENAPSSNRRTSFGSTLDLARILPLREKNRRDQRNPNLGRPRESPRCSRRNRTQCGRIPKSSNPKPRSLCHPG